MPKRLQLELPDRSFERLEQMKERTEAASYAEVVRQALRLYEDMLDEARRGAEFMVRRPGRDLGPYQPFMVTRS